MSGTLYRRDAPTLQDLLLNGGANASPQDSSAPTAPVQGGLDSSTSALYQRLLQPDNQGPEPTVDKRSTPASIFRILGDAVNTYASIMGRTPLDHSSFERYLAGLQKQKEAKAEYDQRTASARERASLRGAEFLIDRKDRAQMKADEIQGRKDLLSQNQELKRQEDVTRAAQFQQQKALDEDRLTRQMQHETDMQAARLTQEKSLAGISRKIANGDKEAQRQQEALGSAMAYIGATADNVQEQLAGDPQKGIPPMTPDQIATKYRRALDAMVKIGLVGDARLAAEAYYKQEITPILQQHENAALEAGSPQQVDAGQSAQDIIRGLLLQKGKQALKTVTNPIYGGKNK